MVRGLRQYGGQGLYLLLQVPEAIVPTDPEPGRELIPTGLQWQNNRPAGFPGGKHRPESRGGMIVRADLVNMLKLDNADKEFTAVIRRLADQRFNPN